MVYSFIVNNFSKEQQSLLLSVYNHTDQPKCIDIDFLKAYKTAYAKTDKPDIFEIRRKLITLVEDLKDGLEVKKSLSGLMIYRFNTDEKPEPIPVPDDMKEHPKKRNITIDLSKYDFSKLSEPDWLEDD